MYHPGKILNVYKEKNNTQATVEMWDENLFTLHVDEKIASKIKKNDIVLVDYRPISEKMQIPKQIITKIFDKKEDIWNTYKEYFRKKKAEASKEKKSQQVKVIPIQSPQHHSFAG